jgi:hypothetical protein
VSRSRRRPGRRPRLPDDASRPPRGAGRADPRRRVRRLAAGWADVERLFLRLFEQEEDSVGLGDGVLVLGWDAEAGRPRLRKFDTESYFPVLSGDQDVDEFPNKVHFAWVECTPDGKEWLHRLTYERRRLPDGEVRRYRLRARRQVAVDGLPDARRLGSGLRRQGRRVRPDHPDPLPDGPPIGRVPRRAAGRRPRHRVDFLPVVHVPNTPAGSKHFGRSLFLSVAQLLDDLGFADSDLAASSELVGNAPLVVSGGSGGGALSRGPGAQYDLPAGGDRGFLDTSKLLDGQIGFVDHLLSRLSVNTRLAEALLGRVKPNEVPSGVALQLGFAPTKSLISKMRLVRGEKHPLLLRFAMRFAQQFGVLPEGRHRGRRSGSGTTCPRTSRPRRRHGQGAAAGARHVDRDGGADADRRPGSPIEDAQEEVERIKRRVVGGGGSCSRRRVSRMRSRSWLGIDPPEQPRTPGRAVADTP